MLKNTKAKPKVLEILQEVEIGEMRLEMDQMQHFIDSKHTQTLWILTAYSREFKEVAACVLLARVMLQP